MNEKQREDKEKQEAENENRRYSSTHLLQIGVVCLAVVSFFTTANGMRTYIFTGDKNKMIAYITSAAIQSILLALSMNLPGYLRGIWERRWHWISKLVLCIFSVLLTIVAVGCSSWFSYIYIAEVIHKGAWDTDSELLVQQTYRSELYDARDYANVYRIYLEQSLGEKILLLEEQANQLSDSSVDYVISSGENSEENPGENSGVSWGEETNTYVSGGGTIASSYMSTVIDAMRNALDENSSQEKRDLAALAVADARDNIATEMERIQQNIDRQNNNIESYSTQIANLTYRINTATANTDVTSLNNSINTYTQLIESASEEHSRLETEYTQLDNAMRRLTYYESLLGLNSSTSSISIRSGLLELQTEFFQEEPDYEKILGDARAIFKDLRNGLSTLSGGTDGETDNVDDSESEFSYTNLLVQMNQLIQSLKDYSEVKDIETALEDMIVELRTTDKSDESEPANSSPEPSDEIPEVSDAVPEASDGVPEASGEVPEASDDVPEPTDEVSESNDEISGSNDELSGSSNDASEPSDENLEPSSEIPEPSGDITTGKADSDKSADEKNQWKELWGERLDGLKAQISAMPIYSGTSDIGSGTNGALTESQANILLGYDRSESSARLDDMIRLYVSEHNAVYKGIVYLQSPYRGLAMFALILALSFDLTGFVFGFVIQGNQQQKGTVGMTTKENNQAEWSILTTLNQYMVLTGDYESRDGAYYYKVFKDGLLYQWPVQDPNPYTRGIYVQDKTDPAKGRLVAGVGQELIFAKQAGGPADGVYFDCQLSFEEGSLILNQKNQQRFLASVNEYVPVHSYNPNMGENQTIPAEQLATSKIDAKTAVVALNIKGTRVSAIYMIELE